MTKPASDLGMRVIVAYKMARATIALALAAIFTITALSGGAEHLHQVAEMMRDHAASALTLRAAELFVRASTRHYLVLGAMLLTLDGAFTAFEAWALRRRYSWAPWLVVLATSSLVPWEVVELVRRVRVGRLALLASNLAVVFYLVWRERKERTS